MKKNGFTLVELLAVIVILAILMVAAGAGVMATMNNSKINTFKNEALVAVDSAQQMYSNISMVSKTSNRYFVTDTDGEYQAMCVTLAGLVNNGYLNKDISTYGGVVLVEIPFDGGKPKYMVWMHNSQYGINGVERDSINKLKFKKENNGGKNGITSADEISGGKVGIVTNLKGINKVINLAQTNVTELSASMAIGFNGGEIYTCPSGGEVEGDKCVTSTTVASTGTDHKCPTNFTYDSSLRKCKKENTVTKTCKSPYDPAPVSGNCVEYEYATKQCDTANGYKPYQDRCRKETNAMPLYNIPCKSPYEEDTTRDKYYCYQYDYANKKCPKTTDTQISNTKCRRIESETPTCPSNYRKPPSSSSRYCYRYELMIIRTMSCPSGYQKIDVDRCRYTSTGEIAIITGQTNCPSGYNQLSNYECGRQIGSTLKKCNSGYDLVSGTECRKETIVDTVCPNSTYQVDPKNTSRCRRLFASRPKKCTDQTSFEPSINSSNTCVRVEYKAKSCQAGFQEFGDPNRCRRIKNSQPLKTVGVCPANSGNITYTAISNSPNCTKRETEPSTDVPKCPTDSILIGDVCIHREYTPANKEINSNHMVNGDQEEPGYSITDIYSYSSKENTQSLLHGTVSEKERGGTGAHYDKIPCINGLLDQD